MRRTWCLVVLVAALVALAGCRSVAPPPEPAPPNAVSQPVRAVAPAYPLTLTDALGKQVTFKAAPQRIVSLSPPLTESLFALGLGDRVVGVTRFCNWPPEAKQKEKVGGVSDPSTEKIVSLNPDVAFVTVGTPMAVVDALRQGGIGVFSVDPKTYVGVETTLETLGRICGVPEAGKREADKLRAAAESVQKLTRGVPAGKRPRVLFVVWMDPLFVAGPGTFMDDLVSLAAGTNVAAAAKNPWQEYPVEMAVAEDPQVLLVTAEHTPGSRDVEAQVKKLRSSATWRGVSAVKSGRVALINSDLVTRSGPRLAEGLLEVARGLHPELFAAKAGEAKPVGK
jgi:iron complex transport system substrate-binding protein